MIIHRLSINSLLTYLCICLVTIEFHKSNYVTDYETTHKYTDLFSKKRGNGVKCGPFFIIPLSRFLSMLIPTFLDPSIPL